MNQTQLAEWLGWSQTMVSYLEAGVREPSPLQARRLRAFESLVGANNRVAKNKTQPCKWWTRGQEKKLKRDAFDVFEHLEGCPACTAFVVKMTR
jgi:hypothetical protein